MKITFDMPRNVDALTWVFYMEEPMNKKRIWSWTIAPKDGAEYYVVHDPDGYAIEESVNKETKE